MRESIPFGGHNHSELSTGFKAIGHFLMIGLIRAGDCILPSGQLSVDNKPQLNGLHLIAFKWFRHTSEFERQVSKLKDSNLDI